MQSFLFKDFIPENHEVPVDRLCVLVRAAGTDHLLGAPGISSSSGIKQFVAIQEYLTEFEIADHVHIVCFDTTASNTGLIKGSIYR